MKKTIVNINEAYGDMIRFDSVQEMADAILACGYTLPENGLEHGIDYLVYEEEDDEVQS